MRDLIQYPFEIQPISADEGGGFLISFPDFSDCISDGETPEEAIKNGYQALKATINALKEFGHPVPEPNSGGVSGKFVSRVPRSIHQKLVLRAKQEGVSLNTLVVALISEGLGIREGKRKKAA